MTSNSSSSNRFTLDARWHPTDYLRILYKRRWIAIPAFLVMFLSGVLATIRAVPIYEATTQILVEQDRERSTSIDSLLEDRDNFDDEFYQTQYRLMRSRSMALRTAIALEESGPPERVPQQTGPDLSLGALIGYARSAAGSLLSMMTGSGKDDANRAEDASDIPPMTELQARAGQIDAILGGLTVAPVLDSRLVNLRFQSPDPQYAARAANEIAKQYQQQTLEVRFMASKEANDWLSAQLEEQRKLVLQSEAALQRYRETENAASVSDHQNIVIQKLTELNAQVTRARIDRLDKEAYYNRVLEIQKNGESLESIPAIMANETVQKLRSDLNSMKSELVRLQNQGFGESWPAVRELSAQIATAETRLQGEIAQVVASIRNSFLAAQNLERSLAGALEAQKGESTQLDRKAVQYAALEREAAGNRELYENLMERTKEAGVSSQYRSGSVRVIDPAEVPASPILPDVKQDLLMAGFKGVVLAFLLVFGFEYFDSRIKSPDEIKAHLGLPFLGMMPLAGGKNHSGEALMLSSDVPPSFSESIRSIRTAVLFSSAEAGARSLVVTSTGPSEGKTVVSSSLAISLAQTGQRTLIVDADMRRPRIHEELGRSQEPGLSNVLVGETQLTEAIRLTSVTNLSLLAAGHIPPNPAELLGSTRYMQVLEELKQRFDWIIIDAPPVMPVTDAAILANTAGGVLFVVGAEMTARQNAMEAIDQLRGANAKFVGVVLNRVNLQGHHYYYSPYYRKEYGKYYAKSASS